MLIQKLKIKHKNALTIVDLIIIFLKDYPKSQKGLYSNQSNLEEYEKKSFWNDSLKAALWKRLYRLPFLV